MSEPKLNWTQLLEEALTTPGNLSGVYDRFHLYSLTNMLLFRIQGLHEPMASYSRWKALGRQVMQGSRASEVIVPVIVKESANSNSPEIEGIKNNDDRLEEKRERVGRLIGFKLVRAVFPLSATEGPEVPPVDLPGWDLQTALDQLGVRQAPFESPDGNMQGYSHGLEFAINPVAVHPAKTTMHEIGHILLGHTLPHRFEEYASHRGVMEFQAEATAYLVMNELEQLDEETASHSRGYIRHWLGEEQPPDQAIRQVFTTAERILKAGRLAAEV